MNCANHPQTAAAAYCRTCGKPVCEGCKRDVHGVIYCEDCLAARVGQQAKVAGAAPAAQTYIPPQSTYNPGGPNPAIAGILSGFLPFGTGAMYSGEFMRALVHGGIFFGLIAIAVNVGDKNDTYGAFIGMAIAFWYFFMIFDSVRVARAKQRGEPVPDLFGFGLASPAEPRVVQPGGAVVAGATDVAQPQSRAPIGAFILIGIGVLFLIGNIWDFDWVVRLWPLILIAIGVRLFFRRRWRDGISCGCMRCTAQCSMGAAVLTTLGVLLLLHMNLGYRFEFGRTFPFLLIVIGIVAFLRNSGSTEGHIEPPPPSTPSQPVAPPTEVHHG